MQTMTWRLIGVVLSALGILAGFGIVRIEARPRLSGPVSRAQKEASQASVDADNIGGVVSSTNGPEAGVWVIAETTDFQT